MHKQDIIKGYHKSIEATHVTKTGFVAAVHVVKKMDVTFYLNSSMSLGQLLQMCKENSMIELGNKS